jgi:hypothetical protein
MQGPRLPQSAQKRDSSAREIICQNARHAQVAPGAGTDQRHDTRRVHLATSMKQVGFCCVFTSPRRGTRYKRVNVQAAICSAAGLIVVPIGRRLRLPVDRSLAHLRRRSPGLPLAGDGLRRFCASGTCHDRESAAAQQAGVDVPTVHQGTAATSGGPARACGAIPLDAPAAAQRGGLACCPRSRSSHPGARGRPSARDRSRPPSGTEAGHSPRRAHTGSRPGRGPSAPARRLYVPPRAKHRRAGVGTYRRSENRPGR